MHVVWVLTALRLVVGPAQIAVNPMDTTQVYQIAPAGPQYERITAGLSDSKESCEQARFQLIVSTPGIRNGSAECVPQQVN